MVCVFELKGNAGSGQSYFKNVEEPKKIILKETRNVDNHASFLPRQLDERHDPTMHNAKEV